MSDHAIPDPEKKLAVIKRYLHILALIQSNKDATDWNGSTLADALSLDEPADSPLSDKAVRDYINDHLRDALDMDVSVIRGGRRIGLDSPLESDLLMQIISVYTNFVITDSSRDAVLRTFVGRHPDDCLWILARIYFASRARQRIRFDYTTNAGRLIEAAVYNPYHLVMRNNNLYLVCRSVDRAETWTVILNRIENLAVLEERFDETVPSIDDLYRDTLGSFIGKKYDVKIRFEPGIRPMIEQVLSILEPEMREEGDRVVASFCVSDDRYLCKQLFLYGNRVEIVEPPELRELMVSMIRESAEAYTELA